MSIISPAEFPIRFTVEAGPRGVVSHDALHIAIAAALGLGSQVTPRYTSVGAREPRVPRPGERLEGFGRVNGVRGVTTDGQKIAMVSYSFFYQNGHGSFALWSADLDDDNPAPVLDKPNELWFRDSDKPVVLSDELRATIKLLAPRKTRAATSRAAR
jgi:hypothetical protein